MGSGVRAFSVKISIIAHATEEPDKVARAVRSLSPDEASMRSTINRVKGHHGNEIVTLFFTIRNAKLAENFLQKIWNGLSELDRTDIFSSLTSRINSAGTLFLRIDKQETMKGRVSLQDTDPIKIEISFKKDPSRYDEFVDDIRENLEELSGSVNNIV
jgi:RNA binding exosome subunit